jgi:molybdate transport system substrate-binding protein
LVAIVAVGGCGSGGDRETVTVLAASSLAPAFEVIEVEFEAAHPDVDLVVSSGGSPTLAAQAAEGSPAALLITADDATMRRAVDAGVVDGGPRSIATNRATIAVPADPPGDLVDEPADLAREDLVVVLCAVEVPCGAAAVDLLDALGVDAAPDSLETSVQAVVGRLRLGEADAGVVYRTDVTASDGALRAVADEAPDGVGQVRYVAAVLESQPGGPQVLAFLEGVDGRRILADFGFGPP